MKELMQKKYVELKAPEKAELKALKDEFFNEEEPAVEPTTAPDELPRTGMASVPQLDMNFKSYKQLDPPIVKYLEENWSNWLNYFEIGQEYKKGYSGRGIYIKVPKDFSTEWKEEERIVYDNRTRRPKVDEKGHTMKKIVITEDIRWCSLMIPQSDVIQWIGKVYTHIITNARKKGLSLPGTGVPFVKSPQAMTNEEYEQSLNVA